MHNYPAESLDIQARLYGLGLLPTHLMLIEWFIVAYGLFKTTLERALWTLSDTDLAGTRPFTEKGGEASLRLRCRRQQSVSVRRSRIAVYLVTDFYQVEPTIEIQLFTIQAHEVPAAND